MQTKISQKLVFDVYAWTPKVAEAKIYSFMLFRSHMLIKHENMYLHEHLQNCILTYDVILSSCEL